MMRLLGKHRQVLAQLHTWGGSGDGIERSAILGGASGFMSQVSTCEAPPHKKNKITDFACPPEFVAL